jgi:hypothetical protein
MTQESSMVKNSSTEPKKAGFSACARKLSVVAPEEPKNKGKTSSFADNHSKAFIAICSACSCFIVEDYPFGKSFLTI